MSDFHLYSDNQQPRELPVMKRNKKISDPALYKPSKALQDAVNVAIAIGQPLLVTGEPGTGKTELANHVAWYFKMGEPLVFNAQTTSTATDLFYKYDALAHFQYAQTQATPLTPNEVEKRFIHYQALGEAIRSSTRRVVLIDEIDKAPRDLPNDVLAAINKLRFEVPEIKEQYRASAENRPLVIITSNSEKNLPDAFLRRVSYYHIPFPEPGFLMEILASKIEGLGEEGLGDLVDHFYRIREGKQLRKNPATAELIYWAMLLQKIGFDSAKLKKGAVLDDSEKDQLLMSYSALAKTKEDLATMKKMIEVGK